MLFRFRASQAADLGIVDIGKTRRPKAVSSVDTVPACEKWRGQVLKEISRKTSKIQEESLSDYQLRDLNDEINKLMREKWMWEKQIRNLGGPNYMRGGPGPGYRYYGRANELPGVKEMQEAEARKQREERDDAKGGARDAETARLQRLRLDASYFGWGRDNDDDAVMRYEAAREEELKAAMNAQRDEPDNEWESLPGDTGDGVAWQVPSLEDVQEELMDRRKRKLLDKIGT